MPSSKPSPSRLDSAQVLQHAFDDTTGALRTTTEATVVVGSVEVAVDHQTDSVKIGNGTRFADVAVDNSLKVSNGLVKESFDYFNGVHTSTTSTYTYKRGGSAGEVVAVVTVTYVDGTKREIASLSVT
jgi:hypothetical protein